MLYDSVSRVIGDICVRLGIPLTHRQIGFLLHGVIEDDILDAVCDRMLEEGRLVHFDKDTVTTRNMRFSCRVNLLISAEYQQLGMTLLQTESTALVRYIPSSAEHRFFELKPSSIGPQAGLGLFVRPTRRIPQGCIMCEYRGRSLRSPPRGKAGGVYVVRVRSSHSFIDGVTANGDHLSLATFINDCGPLAANAELMEYSTSAGRVFIVANRDVEPGEEVFVTYGATYWGFSSYSEIPKSPALKKDAAPPPRRRRRTELLDAVDINGLFKCLKCGELTTQRAAQLHGVGCGDPLTTQLLFHLCCLPRSEFTAMCSASRLLPTGRLRSFRKATSLVSLSDPQTFSHTHEDVVQDLEFSFTEAEEPSSP